MINGSKELQRRSITLILDMDAMTADQIQEAAVVFIKRNFNIPSGQIETNKRSIFIDINKYVKV